MRERSQVPSSKPHRKLPGRRKERRPRIVVLGRTRLHIECVARALGTSGRFEVSYSESVSESNKGIPSPDVIIVDLRLKVTPAAVRDLKARFPKASLLGTGGENDEEVVLDLVRAGLDTVLLEDAPLRALREAIERCLHGEAYLPTEIFKRIAQRVASIGAGSRGIRPLSAREREVLGLVEQGLTNKEIARRLGVEPATVKNHVHSIMAKSSVHRRMEAAARLRTTRSAPETIE